METITISEILPGYILFLNGKKKLAKNIKFFQRLKYGKNGYWFLNHVGFFVKNMLGDWLVYEQDAPGRFGCNRFDTEYLKDKEDVYIGIPKITLTDEGMHGLIQDAEMLAGQDCLLNYSYKSFIGFIFNSIYYKLFNREFWITGKPKGSTCSQVTAFLYQNNFDMFLQKDWWTYFPNEIADSEELIIKKLIY